MGFSFKNILKMAKPALTFINSASYNQIVFFFEFPGQHFTRRWSLQ
jgi:hypothetical protein